MLKKRKISISIIIALLGVVFLWRAERAIRRFPQIMLPHWRLRYYVNHNKSKVVPDIEVGFLAPPNQHNVVQTSDFTFIRDTDSKGFPNKDPWPERASIVFLGDSLVLGEGVGLVGSFPHLVSQMLPNQTVVNLGLGGAGAERQYLIYRRFGVGLHPRLVVACLYLASDFDNDLRFHSWLRQGRGIDYNSYRLGFQRTQDTRWAFHPGRLLERSWLFGMGQEIVWRWIGRNNRIQDRYHFADGTEVLFDRCKVEFATEAVAANDARIDALLMSLEKLRDLVVQHDATLLVLLIPSKEELFGISASAGAFNAVAYTRQRLQEAKFSVLDLYPAIRQGGAKQSPYFSQDIHLNEYGNRIVAEQFVAWFN
jgi:hypothetical protein